MTIIDVRPPLVHQGRRSFRQDGGGRKSAIAWRFDAALAGAFAGQSAYVRAAHPAGGDDAAPTAFLMPLLPQHPARCGSENILFPD